MTLALLTAPFQWHPRCRPEGNWKVNKEYYEGCIQQRIILLEGIILTIMILCKIKKEEDEEGEE
jgi:hypothetical protein